MFWIAIARITNSPSPSRSDANAVPIASPSGRLWTKRTAKTRAEVRAPGPLRPMNTDSWSSRARATPSRTPPTTSPARTSKAEPSSAAGSSRPTIEATPITPAATPSRNGVSATARVPSSQTGTAPRPVASMVAQAARKRTSRSGMGATLTAASPVSSGPAPVPARVEGGDADDQGRQRLLPLSRPFAALLRDQLAALQHPFAQLDRLLAAELVDRQAHPVEDRVLVVDSAGFRGAAEGPGERPQRHLGGAAADRGRHLAQVGMAEERARHRPVEVLDRTPHRLGPGDLDAAAVDQDLEVIVDQVEGAPERPFHLDRARLALV